MTKRKRLLSLLLSLWMLLPLFAVFIIPAAAGAAEMDASYVVDDLNTMGVDITKYPGDAADDRVEILKFLEFGYKANGDYSEYGLYLYLYNPSGKEISGDRNAVQLAYGLNAGGVTSYIKYRLTVLSHSTGSGYENVFWKVKVEGAESIAPLLNKAARKYLISGVEVLRPGNANATDYSYGVGTFTFTGYHKGCQSNDYSTLRCIADKLDVVKLELHPVSYFTETTSRGSYAKGEEIFGVYFSVPKWIIAKYGNLDDDNLRGLDAVKGSYREVFTNGILTNSSVMQNAFVTPSDQYFVCRYVTGASDERMAYSYQDPDYKYNSFMVGAPEKTVERIYNAFLTSSALSGLDAATFRTLYANAGKLGDKKSMSYYTVRASDFATAEKAYSFGEWIKNLFTGKGGSSTGTISFQQLVRLKPSEVGIWSDEAISKNLLVNEAEADALQKFTLGTVTSGDTAYLMRFAVRDWGTAAITGAGTLNNGKGTAFSAAERGNSYYFEKTVFEDFDVLELHYRTSENKLSVVPVSASPIDVTGGVPTPGPSNPNEKPSESTASNWWEQFNVLETWIKVVAVVAMLVLLFIAFRLFGGFFGFVGRMITAPFRLVVKGISAGVSAGRSLQDGRLERKAQKEHDEDRANLKTDRERRQKFEDEDRTEAKTDRDRRRAREDRAEEKAEARSRSKENEKKQKREGE